MRGNSMNFTRSLTQAVSENFKNFIHVADHEDLAKNPFDYSYDDLLGIDKDRRSLLTRVKRFNVGNITTSFHGTVLPNIVFAPATWFIIVLYIGLRIMVQHVEVGVELPLINTTLVSIIGGFMSFFLVFFVSQAYSRLTAQYDNSMRIEGRIFNLCYLSRCSLPPAEAWRLWRYLNTIHVVGYTGLSMVYTEQNVFDHMNEKYQLLTETETKRLKAVGVNIGGSAYREVVGWCLELLYKQFHLQRQQSMDIITLQAMMNEVLVLRGCIGSLFDYADQPIPFVYVHLLSFLTIFYLPLITYTTAVYLPTDSKYYFPDILGAFVVFLNVIFVVGTREIGRAMICPYEDTPGDLSVLHYLNFTILMSRRVLTGASLIGQSLESEEEMEAARPSKGAAFDDNKLTTGTYVDAGDQMSSNDGHRLATIDAYYSTSDAVPSAPAANARRTSNPLGRINSSTASSASSPSASTLPFPWQRQKGEEGKSADYIAVSTEDGTATRDVSEPTTPTVAGKA